MNKRVLVMFCVVALLAFGFGGAAAQDDEPISIIFMHHSTGLGIIQGGVREGFTALGYDFWDHGYNEEGLVDPAGNYLGTNWDVPGDNTDPDGWYEIFQQPYTDPPTNTFSHMLQYDVIIFKSCFPNSDIYDDEMLANYQRYYLAIRDVIDQHPDKIFVPWTTPPLVPNETTLENAARARQWSEYLTSDEYLDGHPNIFTFDIFSLLADDDGFLRAEYRGDEWDSHPNDFANQTIAPIFVDFVDQAVHNFVPGEASVQPVVVDVTPVTDSGTGETPSVITAWAPGDMIDDFENDPGPLEDRWWTYTDGGATIDGFEIASPGFDSDRALKVTYNAPAQGYGNFSLGFDPMQDWSAADGVTFYWQADQPDLVVSVFIVVVDPQKPDEPTPFEIYLTPSVGDWEQVSLAWDAFIKVDWMGDAGAEVFDPAHIHEMGISFGDWDNAQKATLWVDQIQLATAMPE
jgi:hypothetical protein